MYIFQAPDAAELALTIDGTPLKGRPLRVKRYMMKVGRRLPICLCIYVFMCIALRKAHSKEVR